MRYKEFNDLRLFLWLIPVINCINYYLTYSQYGPAWRFVATFTIDTVMGYIAWFICRLIIDWLDRRLPYSFFPVKRILVQLALTTLSGVLSIIMLTELVNWLANSEPVPVSFYTTDIFIISIWFFVINGIYSGLHYYYQWKKAEERLRASDVGNHGGFVVRNSRVELIIPYSELACFYVEGDYSVLLTVQQKKFLLDYSLDQIEKKIPQGLFFRLNRRFVVHRQYVKGYEKSENGKLIVQLADVLQHIGCQTVSRTKAPNFRSWFYPAA